MCTTSSQMLLMNASEGALLRNTSWTTHHGQFWVTYNCVVLCYLCSQFLYLIQRYSNIYSYFKSMASCSTVIIRPFGYPWRQWCHPQVSGHMTHWTQTLVIWSTLSPYWNGLNWTKLLHKLSAAHTRMKNFIFFTCFSSITDDSSWTANCCL